MLQYRYRIFSVIYSPPAPRSEDGSAGGGLGEECRAVRAWKPRRLLGQSRSQQKSFLFLLEEKIGARKIKKSEENFFAGWRALASGGGAERVSFAQSRFGFGHIIAHSKVRRVKLKRVVHIDEAVGSNPATPTKMP